MSTFTPVSIFLTPQSETYTQKDFVLLVVRGHCFGIYNNNAT